MADHSTQDQSLLVSLTVEIVAAHVSNNDVAVDEVASLVTAVYGALSTLGESQPAEEAAREPAVSVRASVKKDYLVCLEDGKKVKILKRHLSSAHGLTPDEYRDRWNLPADYPMAAPGYSAMRSQAAKDLGLGRKPGQKVGKRRK